MHSNIITHRYRGTREGRGTPAGDSLSKKKNLYDNKLKKKQSYVIQPLVSSLSLFLAPVSMRESSSPRGSHTSSFIVRQGGFDTHLCTHLQQRAISLPGNGPGITVRKRRQGDAQQHSFFAQERECIRAWFPSMADPRLTHSLLQNAAL